MKKVLIPTLCLVFLLSASPVMAADDSGNWFTRLTKLFSIFTGFPSQNPPFMDSSLTPTPFQKGRVSPRDDWPSGTPKGFGRPTDIVRPTAKTKPEVNDSDKGRGKPETTGKPEVTEKPEVNDNNDNNDNKDKNGNKNGPRGPSGVSGENKADRIRTVVNRILDSYETRISNYSDFLSKVRARRDKLAADGKDVSKLTLFIGTASGNLTAAAAQLSGVKSKVATMDFTGSMKDVQGTLRPLLSDLRKTLTGLHKSMSETVAEIVDKSAADREKGTPTVRDTGRPDNPWENGKGRGNNTK